MLQHARMDRVHDSVGEEAPIDLQRELRRRPRAAFEARVHAPPFASDLAAAETGHMICAWCSVQVPDAAASCAHCGVATELSRDAKFRDDLRSVQIVAERSRLRHPKRLLAGGILVLAVWAVLLATRVELTAPVVVAAVAVFPPLAIVI